MEIGVGNQMSSVIAHQLMDESIEIDVDGVPENTQSTLTLSRDGEMKASLLNVVDPIAVLAPRRLVMSNNKCSYC